MSSTNRKLAGKISEIILAVSDEYEIVSVSAWSDGFSIRVIRHGEFIEREFSSKYRGWDIDVHNIIEALEGLPVEKD